MATLEDRIASVEKSLLVLQRKRAETSDAIDVLRDFYNELVALRKTTPT